MGCRSSVSTVWSTVLAASGPDITRSAAGRIAAESVWLPSILCGTEVVWSALCSRHAHARFAIAGETVEPVFEIDDRGNIESIVIQRWGDPDGSGFGYHSFGGLVERRATFEGFTIPTCLRAGYHAGTERFEKDGEFIRITIDDATFR